MDCPRCGDAMRDERLGGHHGRSVTIDLCTRCQALWFDGHESLSLTPASTLTLFRLIGQQVARPEPGAVDLEKCPRCRARLRITHDMQRATKFEYRRCPNGHGRFITFYEFLREKDFIRPLTPPRSPNSPGPSTRSTVRTAAPRSASAEGAGCAHCGSPLSMLDLRQAEALVAQLQKADARASQPVDPLLPLRLEQARREVESMFDGQPRSVSFDDVRSGLVGAGLKALSRLLTDR